MSGELREGVAVNRTVLCTNEVRAELQEALDDLEKRVRRPEELALKLLRERLAAVPVPRDEWERELLEAARPWASLCRMPR